MATASTKSGKLKNSSAPVTATARRLGNGNEGLLDALKTISSAAQKVAQYSPEIAEFDNLTLEIKSLRVNVTEKGEQIDRLEKRAEDKEKENRQLIDRFSKQAAQWHNDTEQQKISLEVSRAECRDLCARHAQTTKKQTQEALNKEKDIERKLRRVEANLDISERRFKNCESEFSELRDQIGFVSSDTDWFVCSYFSNIDTDLLRPTSFKSLAAQLHELAKNYFGIALPHPGHHVSH
jgi:chromosome segregation ATPase